MSESAPAAIPTDFFTESGFVKSCGMSSHPAVGDTIMLDGKMYTVRKRAWDFDVGGFALLVRINVD
jgi:hypothetical protein